MPDIGHLLDSVSWHFGYPPFAAVAFAPKVPMAESSDAWGMAAFVEAGRHGQDDQKGTADATEVVDFPIQGQSLARSALGVHILAAPV
eukprot:CAMPEP_0180661498 /NCGR_PEP_ID=MMETSP1037_2-20121125/58869_1 /TAXON_ID=632150 /ORGANISM="Azadinium spinosum, Strain 3D9" /LENGTH=87 /DNA_ID=CAMNT_0022689055 /DNA_START=62 /DNA_END=321 /DNA_ORIENTATION=+